ncbi:MAG: metalloregulator ArsR/SmtB family transcription factor [Ancalomicrobiaceae bacterium]|nr:metalloregulator ArsR/SmtB family transcription factor [Ancalomicrobiaceae bacterium]
MNLDELSMNAERAEKLLKALANRHRLMTLCELSKGELSVNALNQRLPLSQSSLSQHLARLREDKLVATRRDAQTIYYRIADANVERLIGLLWELYCKTDCGVDEQGDYLRETLDEH